MREVYRVSSISQWSMNAKSKQIIAGWFVYFCWLDKLDSAITISLAGGFMRALIVLCICYAFLIAETPVNVNVDDAVNDGGPSAMRSREMFSDRLVIDSVGNIRAILGSQGKSIAVCGSGEAVAVFYGEPSGDPNNTMLVRVAYSIDSGATWTKYGPLSGSSRRIYNDIACTPNFNTNGGELWFVWQECTQNYLDVLLKVMIEENVPAAPSPSVPIIPTNAQAPATYPWEPSSAVMQDDPTHVVVTAWSYLANGNQWVYLWISDDGGYSWTDTLPMMQIGADASVGALAGEAGRCRAGHALGAARPAADLAGHAAGVRRRPDQARRIRRRRRHHGRHADRPEGQGGERRPAAADSRGPAGRRLFRVDRRLRRAGRLDARRQGHEAGRGGATGAVGAVHRQIASRIQAIEQDLERLGPDGRER